MTPLCWPVNSLSYSTDMRICFVIDGLGKGGKERQFSYLLTQLLRNGHECIIISFDKRIGFEAFEDKRIIRFFLKPKSRKNLLASTAIFSICKHENPDVIHAWDTYSSLCGVLASKWLGIPLINGSIRTTFTQNRPFPRLLRRLSYATAQSVVANSLAGMQSEGKSLNKKYRVIYNGFDLQTLHALTPGLEHQLPNQEDEQYVMMLANYSRFKDYSTLISAAREVVKELPQVRFILAGKEVKNSLAATIPNELKDQILLYNEITKVDEVLQQIRVGILSSNTEGISNTVMEYMAHKKPVVATNIGGMREIVIDGETGFLIPENDPGGMANAICKLLKDQDLQESMGLRGFENLSQKFSLEKMTGEYQQLYLSMTNKA